MPWLYRISIRHPRTVIAVAVALTLAIAPGMWRLKLRTDGHALVPDTPAIQYDKSVRDQFGVEDVIVLLIQANHPDGIFNVRTLRLVKELTAEFQELEGIHAYNVSSLATEVNDRVVPGTLQFQKLLDPLPQTPAELQRLRSDLEAIRLYTGTVVSRDGASTAVFIGVPAGAGRLELAQKIRDRLDARKPLSETVQVIGAPIAEALLGTQIFDDLGVPDRFLGEHAASLTAQDATLPSQEPSGGVLSRSLDWLRARIARDVGLLPITIILMAAVFLVSFRSPWAAVLPLMEVGACLIVVFGLMGWLDVPIYLTTAILPVILTVTGITDEVHVYGRYTRTLREWAIGNRQSKHASANAGATHADAVRETMDQMWRPVLLTAVTTAVGFLSFAASPIKPVQAFGIWAAVGSLFCMLWSMSVIPAQLVLLGSRIQRVKPPAVKTGSGELEMPGRSPSGVAVFFERLGRAMFRRRYAALGGAGLLVVAAVPGLQRVQVQDSWIDGFAPSSAFRQATRLFNEQFLGAHILQISVGSNQQGYSGELRHGAVDGRIVRVPADGIADPAGLIGYEVMLTRDRPIIVTTGPSAGRQLPVNWLSWVVGASRDGEEVVLTTSMNRGLPDPVLRLEPGDRVRYRLEPNPFKNPAVLERINAFESFIASQRDTKVGGVLGPAAYLSTTHFMSRARNEAMRSIPDDPERIDFLWKQYGWIRGPERLGQIIDPRYTKALITVYMNDANFVDTGHLMDRIRDYEQTKLKPHGLSLGFAGDVAVSQTLIQAIVSTQVRSLLGSLAGIFLVTALLGRSIGWGLYCVLPCCLAVLLNFAVMGWMGMPLGVATSMFAAITLGIGVDYAIHLLERFRLARGSGRSVEDSLVEAVKITGPPVLIDALAVSLGFGVMTLSLVPANARLGGLVVLNLLTCLAATLLLLPALLSIWRPRATHPPAAHQMPSAVAEDSEKGVWQGSSVTRDSYL